MPQSVFFFIPKIISHTLPQTAFSKLPQFRPSKDTLQTIVLMAYAHLRENIQEKIVRALHLFSESRFETNESQRKLALSEASKLHRDIFFCRQDLFEINLHEFVACVYLENLSSAEDCLKALKRSSRVFFSDFFKDLENNIQKLNPKEIITLNDWNIDAFMMAYYQNNLSLEQKSINVHPNHDLSQFIFNDSETTWVHKVAWLKFFENQFSSHDEFDLEISKFYFKGDEIALMEQALQRILSREHSKNQKWYQVWKNKDPFNRPYAHALANLATYYQRHHTKPEKFKSIKSKIKQYFHKFPETKSLFGEFI